MILYDEDTDDIDEKQQQQRAVIRELQDTTRCILHFTPVLLKKKVERTCFYYYISLYYPMNKSRFARLRVDAAEQSAQCLTS